MKHQDIAGVPQPGRMGLGWWPTPKVWSKAPKKKRKDLVISEVMQVEEDSYKIKAVGQHQGRWTAWEVILNRTTMWAFLLRLPV